MKGTNKQRENGTGTDPTPFFARRLTPVLSISVDWKWLDQDTTKSRCGRERRTNGARAEKKKRGALKLKQDTIKIPAASRPLYAGKQVSS